MNNYQKVFKDFDYDYIALGQQLGESWMDASWGNDACPCFVYDLDTEFESQPYTLYFDYDNAELGENAKARAEGKMLKFELVDQYGSTIFETNDWEEMKNKIINENIVQKYFDEEQEKRDAQET